MLCSNCRKKIKDATVDGVLAPKEFNLPEPFYGAVAHYFSKENVVKNLDYSQVAKLKLDLCRVAVNYCDGNKTKACKMLGINRATLIEMIKQLEK